jgi:hypothetical protein
MRHKECLLEQILHGLHCLVHQITDAFFEESTMLHAILQSYR